MSITAKTLDELIDRQRNSFIADYKKIVESPSVSSQPVHKKDVLETVKIAENILKAAGATVTIYETKGNPVLHGRIENKAGAPTVAIYNHLDVQPAENGKDGWTREPFKFTEENGRFYSRGTTDDKGPAMTALWGAKLAKELKVPVNVEFIWETEEEIGSPNFAEFLGKAKKNIQATSVVVSDTQWIAEGRPALCMGLRGLMSAVVKLRTAKKDAHSGSVGGAARNPVTELCALAASCVDARTGEIKIPGVAETWKKPSTEMLKEYLGNGFTVPGFKKSMGLDKLRTEDAAEILARIWLSPTFEVHGLAGGYQDHGVKTVVPPAAELKVSMRLVAGQDPDKIFELFSAHVKKTNPDCEIQREGYLAPYAAPANQPETKAIIEAIEFGFNAKASPAYEGGSIGAVITMRDMLQVPILFMGLSLPDDCYHGPDESFAWTQILGGAKAFCKYFELIAAKS